MFSHILLHFPTYFYITVRTKLICFCIKEKFSVWDQLGEIHLSLLQHSGQLPKYHIISSEPPVTLSMLQTTPVGEMSILDNHLRQSFCP